MVCDCSAATICLVRGQWRGPWLSLYLRYACATFVLWAPFSVRDLSYFRRTRGHGGHAGFAAGDQRSISRRWARVDGELGSTPWRRTANRASIVPATQPSATSEI